jgi:hypothetical protein
VGQSNNECNGLWVGPRSFPRETSRLSPGLAMPLDPLVGLHCLSDRSTGSLPGPSLAGLVRNESNCSFGRPGRAWRRCGAQEARAACLERWYHGADQEGAGVGEHFLGDPCPPRSGRERGPATHQRHESITGFGQCHCKLVPQCRTARAAPPARCHAHRAPVKRRPVRRPQREAGRGAGGCRRQRLVPWPSGGAAVCRGASIARRLGSTPAPSRWRPGYRPPVGGGPAPPAPPPLRRARLPAQVNTLVMPPEKHISVHKDDLLAALRARLPERERGQFDDLVTLMEGVASFDFMDLKERMRSNFLPFASGAKNQVGAQRGAPRTRWGPSGGRQEPGGGPAGGAAEPGQAAARAQARGRGAQRRGRRAGAADAVLGDIQWPSAAFHCYSLRLPHAAPPPNARCTCSAPARACPLRPRWTKRCGQDPGAPAPGPPPAAQPPGAAAAGGPLRMLCIGHGPRPPPPRPTPPHPRSWSLWATCLTCCARATTTC